MAVLVTGVATLTLQPNVKETPTSSWVDTTLSINYHIQNQKLYLESYDNEISMQVEEFHQMIHKSREYIKSLPILRIYPKGKSKSIRFFPLESTFSLELSCGLFLDKSRVEGDLFLTFNMDLKVLKVEEIRDDIVGFTARVSIPNYLLFLDNLEQEIKAIQ